MPFRNHGRGHKAKLWSVLPDQRCGLQQVYELLQAQGPHLSNGVDDHIPPPESLAVALLEEWRAPSERVPRRRPFKSRPKTSKDSYTAEEL